MQETKELYDYLVGRLKEFFEYYKYDKAVVAISGGIDSALVACMTADAIGSQNVIGIAMPSQYSSEGSVTDARCLAENLEIDFKCVSIRKMLDAAMLTLNACGELVDPTYIFGNAEIVHAGHVVSIVEENLQARIRANIAMAFSNKRNAFVINTCNLTEDLLGYATMYGDATGAIAPLGEVGKMTVYELARYRNTVSLVIPESTITKAPSAELKPDQTDEESLPAPYSILDPLTREIWIDTDYCKRHIDEDYIEKLTETYGCKKEIVLEVIRLMKLNKYKAKQAPPAIKV